MNSTTSLKIVFIFACFFLNHLCYAQHDTLTTLAKIESYIISDSPDSARSLLNQVDQKQYSYLVDLLNSSKAPEYSSLSGLAKSQFSRQETNFGLLNQYLLNHLSSPSETKTIDKSFVDLMYSLISSLRNNNQLNEADSLNDIYVSYINEYDTTDIQVLQAKAYSLVHPMVLATIQGRGEEAERTGKQLLQIGESISDTTIMIMANFYLYDVYAVLRNLERSIEVAEETRRLDELRSKKSNFYYENLFHLADVYDYLDEVSGTPSDSVLPIILKMHHHPSSRNKSYELLARRMVFLKKYPERQAQLLDTLEVNNVLEFVDKVKTETEGVLFSYDQVYLDQSLAKVLAAYGYWPESNNMLLGMVRKARKVFTEDLSQSLAEQETKQIRREKELAIAHEKEQTKLYSFIAILVGILFLLSIVAFVRQRKQSQLLAESKTELETTLHEKQLLLKEVHHRVKNNFQIVSSLLELQSKGIEDEKAKELAAEGRNRVKSMALIHQRLYQNDDLLIYFNDYIEKLVQEISAMYGAEQETKIQIDVEKVAFDIDTAIPLGLIVNELVTNAFKYGQGSEEKRISISIQKDKEDFYKLQVKDNGAGLPANMDVSKAKSLGLRLVRRLSKQLHGSIQYYNLDGAIFDVLFKDTQAREMVE